MNQNENTDKVDKSLPTSTVTIILGLFTALILTVLLNGYAGFKSTVSQVSLLDSGNLFLANVANASTITVEDKWHPGIYVKIEDWQLQNPAQMDKIYEELATTPQLRGIKVTMLWGRYETRDLETGISTYDFSQVDDILARLATLDNKHLIISFPWREFQSTAGADKILPNDLRNGVVWNDDPAWEHTDFDYLWAYKMSNASGSYAYNMKLWDPTLLSRLDAFFAALGNHVDSHPNLTQISTTESAIGSPVIPFVEGEGRDAQYAGQLAVSRMLKNHFPNTIVLASLNFDRPFVAEAVPILLNEKIGINSPNSNLNFAINTTSTPPGVLTYYPNLSGKLVLTPEIQGDDYRSTYGAGASTDNPPYDYLYNRVKNDLKANYVVMQRNSPYWLGGTISGTTTTVPSMLEFIRTYPDIINDTTGAGGLNSVKPTMLINDVPPPPPPAPDLVFSASSTEVMYGGSSVLFWSATNSSACEASGDWSGSKLLEGNEIVSNITVPKNFILICTGEGGSIERNVSVNVLADTVPPITPSGLISNNVSTSSVSLGWSVSTDNIAVIGYNVYRDGVKIATVTGLNFSDTGLIPGTNYVYTVSAIDEAGNESIQSSSVSVNTTVIIPFTISNYSVSNITKNSATVNVTLSNIGSVVIKYGKTSTNLSLVKNSTTLKNSHSLPLSSLERNRTYFYQVVATSDSGEITTSPIATFKTRN